MLQPGQPPKPKKSDSTSKLKIKTGEPSEGKAPSKKSRKGSLKSINRTGSEKSLDLGKSPRLEYTCLIHEGCPLSLFCNTCDEIVCEGCVQQGPHNTAGHVLQRIEHAHAHRKAVIAANLSGPVNARRQRLEAKMSNLTFQVEKLRESSSFIHRDTKVYFENMVDSLKDTFKAETAELAARIDYYEQEVREMNGLISYFNNFLSPEAFFEFLVIYPRLWAKFQDMEERQHDDGQHLDHKQVTLSHKVLENKKIVIEMNKFRMSDMFKSDVLLDLRLDLIAIKTGKFNFKTTSTQDIIAGLVRKLKSMCKATQDQLMVCYFCGNISSSEFVNEDCKVNKGKAMPNWCKHQV